jgi:hypothetical protein
MTQTPDERKLAAKIAPAIHEFTNKIADAGLVVSALIFDPSGEFLIKAGNCQHRGVQFIRLHTYLSMVVAQLDAAGHYNNESITDAPRTVDPDEIAMKLATACIQVPEDLVPSRIRELAIEFLDAQS